MRNLNTKSVAVVTINSVELAPVEINGERVVTLAMVDDVHGRASGTAGRNFRENRDRLVEGEDYYNASCAEIRRNNPSAIPAAYRRSEIIVLTESGYLMLVKSLTDDLAWEVQKALVKSYFAKPATIVQTHRQLNPGAGREARLSFKQNLAIAKMAGFTGNQALLAANKATLAMTGIDTLNLMGAAQLPSPDNDTLLTPTEIGRRAEIGSPRVVNTLLCDMGLQHAFRDAKGNLYYELTETGKQTGGVMLDTGKKHGSGAPVQQLKWPSSILALIQDSAA